MLHRPGLHVISPVVTTDRFADLHVAPAHIMAMATRCGRSGLAPSLPRRRPPRPSGPAHHGLRRVLRPHRPHAASFTSGQDSTGNTLTSPQITWWYEGKTNKCDLVHGEGHRASCVGAAHAPWCCSEGSGPRTPPSRSSFPHWMTSRNTQGVRVAPTVGSIQRL